MKTHLLLLITLLIFSASFAANNNGFKYQAVLRDNNGAVIANEEVSIKVNIIQSTADGTIVYSEEHTISANSNGLILLNIGGGTELSGTFNDINWSNDDYYFQLELNRNNSGYVTMGTAPFMSVPFAKHAQTVSDKNDADADPINEIQDLKLDGNILVITNNSTATEIDLSKYESSNTDEQQLSLSGTELSISNSNTVDLSTIQDGTEDDDANPANEIQALSISNDTIFLSDGGAVKLPQSTTGFSGDYDDLDNKPILSTIANTGSYNDLSDKPTITGDATGNLNAVTVTKVQGMNVSSNSPSDGQVLKWNEATQTWIPAQDTEGEAGTTDGVVSSAGFTGTTTKTMTLTRSNVDDDVTATFTDEVDDADNNPTNEIQDLVMKDHTLTIEGGSLGVDLSAYGDDADADPNNERQDLSRTENTIYITNNNDASEIDLSDLLDNTDNQNLILSSDILSIESGKGSINLTNYIDDADADATNELQDLSIIGNVLSLSKSRTRVTIPTPGWSPIGENSLFAVVNTNGDTVFAVYESGVRVFVDNNPSKAARGGFAVASSRPGSKGETVDILSVTPDSVRIYLNEDETNPKAARGGFAVASSRPGAKDSNREILRITNDSVRIYLDDSEEKAARGGFAVASSRPGGKSDETDLFKISTNAEAEITQNASKILFYPNKDAFLAGTLIIEHPDSVGQNSANIGYQNIAKGQYSQAFGYRSAARGDYSMAVGKKAEANGQNSFALGYGAKAYEDGAFALGSGARFWNSDISAWDTAFTEAYRDGVSIGQGTLAYGLNSAAFGYRTKAYGEQSFACGYGTSAAGYYSIAMGANTKAEGDGSTTMGIANEAWGYYSTAMGIETMSNGFASTTMGNNTVTNAKYSLAIGQYNEDLSPTPNSWVPDNSLFMIGNGTDDHIRSNAFTVYADGDTDINGELKITKSSGTNHLKLVGDATSNKSIEFFEGSTYKSGFGYSSNNDYLFMYESNITTLVAKNGKIGINDITTPSANLHIKQSSGGEEGLAIENDDDNDIWSFEVGTNDLGIYYNGIYKGAWDDENGNYNAASDKRLKEEIKPLSMVLDNVMKLNVVDYYFKSDQNRTKKSVGLIAQDVESLFPSLVSSPENDEGYYSLNYSGFSIIAIKAIQEQQETIEKQQEELDAIKKELAELKQMIMEIKN